MPFASTFSWWWQSVLKRSLFKSHNQELYVAISILAWKLIFKKKSPECAKITVPFDPLCWQNLFCFIAHYKRMYFGSFKFIYLEWTNFSRPVQCNWKYPLLCPEDLQIGADIYNHRCHRIPTVDENLSSITERDIMCLKLTSTGPKMQSTWGLMLA